MTDHPPEIRNAAYCYCDDCRGDGLYVSGIPHNPAKLRDDSDAACDRRFDGLVAYLQELRPVMAATAREQAGGADPTDPVAT